jgi:ribonuclease BN (tRNA processing enzyme)
MDGGKTGGAHIMELQVLGRYAGFPAAGGGAASGYIIKTDDQTIMIDCGSGALSNFMKVSDIHKLDAIVLSHVHADHILDLIPLGYLLLERCMTTDSERKLRRIPVFLPEGSEGVLEGISEVLGHPKFVFAKPDQYGPVYEQFVNLVAGEKDFFSALLPKHPYTKDQVLNFGDLRLSFTEVNHGFPAFAMKFEYRGKIFVFSADTAPCEQLADFAKGADLFLCEATGNSDNGRFYKTHLTPLQAGDIAAKAQVKSLLLTHMTPNTDENWMMDQAKKAYSGEVKVAQELQTYFL